jgi:hypothetical protein
MSAASTNDHSPLVTQDFTRVLESAFHIYQGKHEHLPDLFTNVSTLAAKVSRRVGTRQLMVIGGGLLAVGAFLIVRQLRQSDAEESIELPPATAGGARNGDHRAASADKP